MGVEEVFYGMLVMVVCDEDGVVYVWYDPASYHEVRSSKLNRKESKWSRYLLENFEFIGDKGYKVCEGLRVCKSKEERALRQAVESVNAQIKAFNSISRWGKESTLRVYYLIGYAIGYSLFRKSRAQW